MGRTAPSLHQKWVGYRKLQHILAILMEKQNFFAIFEFFEKNVDEGAIRGRFRKFLYPLVHSPDEDVWSINSVSFIVFSQNDPQFWLKIVRK